MHGKQDTKIYLDLLPEVLVSSLPLLHLNLEEREVGVHSSAIKFV